ncbi:stage III sporulation protein AE [Solibacillus sp. FSL H8-0538]|uniref:stage III sporulation protein AE n=1 Tax=Solibacillus sp. FSL H8-0538 TaxID=2921400 RepID=UPI0030FCB16F
MTQLTTIFAAPLSSALFAIVLAVLYVLLFLILQAFLPDEQKLLEQLFILIFIATFAERIVEAFVVMGQLITVLQGFFAALMPILSTMLLAVQAVFSLLAWNPIVLSVMQLLLFICTKVLIPALLIALFLDGATRILPAISFSKASDLLRASVLSMVIASVLALTAILSFSGIAFFQLNDAIKSPIKKLIEQNIPLIGGLIVEGFSLFNKYQSTATTIFGLSFLSAVWAAAFYPAGTLLIHALTFKLLGALTEPFTNGRISGLFDDVGKTLFVLCAIGFLLGFAIVFIVLICVIIIQLGVGKSY